MSNVCHIFGFVGRLRKLRNHAFYFLNPVLFD